MERTEGVGTALVDLISLSLPLAFVRSRREETEVEETKRNWIKWDLIGSGILLVLKLQCKYFVKGREGQEQEDVQVLRLLPCNEHC